MNSSSSLVFIVDDVAENIQIAISHLQELGCNFAYALSGEQAVVGGEVVVQSLLESQGEISVRELETNTRRAVISLMTVTA